MKQFTLLFLSVIFSSSTFAAPSIVRTQCEISTVRREQSGLTIRILAHCDKINDYTTAFNQKGVDIYAPASQIKKFLAAQGRGTLALALTSPVGLAYQVLAVEGVDVRAEYRAELFGDAVYALSAPIARRISGLLDREQIPRTEGDSTNKRGCEPVRSYRRQTTFSFRDGNSVRVSEFGKQLAIRSCEVRDPIALIRVDVLSDESQKRVPLSPEMSSVLFSVFGNRTVTLEGNIAIQCASAQSCRAIVK